MSARWFIILVMALKLVVGLVKRKLAADQRKKPLPAEVADVYSKERYGSYLSYVADNQKVSLLKQAIELVLNAVIIFTPIFRAIENAAGGNVYLIALMTYGIFWFVDLCTEIPFDYYDTFVIEEKYGKNKQTKKDFIKDIRMNMNDSFQQEC